MYRKFLQFPKSNAFLCHQRFVLWHVVDRRIFQNSALIVDFLLIRIVDIYGNSVREYFGKIFPGTCQIVGRFNDIFRQVTEGNFHRSGILRFYLGAVEQVFLKIRRM